MNTWWQLNLRITTDRKVLSTCSPKLAKLVANKMHSSLKLLKRLTRICGVCSHNSQLTKESCRSVA